MKMAVLLLVVLVSAGVLLSTSEAQNEFNKLPENYKKGVELAVQNVNSHVGIKNHFVFFKSLDKSEIDGGFGVSYLFHHFHLKATRCPKGTLDASKCAFRNDRPLIDCGICYKTYKGEIQEDPKPYLHCVHKPALTKELLAERVEHCDKMSYVNGSPSLLSVKKP